MSWFSSTSAAVDKDVEVKDPPTDSISSISFAPHADYLAVGSWDNNVRVALKNTFFAGWMADPLRSCRCEYMR